MNKNIRKILSIIIVFTVICSILTISYAAVSENYSRMLDNNGFNKLEKLGKTNNSIAQTRSAATLEQSNNEESQSIQNPVENSIDIPTNANTESYQIPNGTVNLRNNNTIGLMSANDKIDASASLDYTEEQISQHRAEKLAKLQEKYPTEYQYIISITDIDPYFYVSLLERIDMWVISDLEEYISEYLENGLDGLEQYHTILKADENNTDEGGEHE